MKTGDPRMGPPLLSSSPARFRQHTNPKRKRGTPRLRFGLVWTILPRHDLGAVLVEFDADKAQWAVAELDLVVADVHPLRSAVRQGKSHARRLVRHGVDQLH